MQTQLSNHKLLTLEDHIVIGSKQRNPQAEQADCITKQLCQKYAIDLPYIDEYCTMTAYVFPHTSLERLVTISLWINFLFFVDDVYDRNITHPYSNDPQKYQQILENTLRIICDGYKPDTDHLLYPVAYELHRRFSKFAAPEWIERFRSNSMKYVRSTTRDIDDVLEDKSVTSIANYMKLRESDSAMESMISAIDLALGVYIPDEILNHPKIQRLIQLTTRVGSFGNDLFSYEREVLRLGSRFNLVNVFMEVYQLSFAEAVHEVVSVINSETKEFLEIEQNLPVWSTSYFNKLARLYTSALKDQIIAGYHWQFTTNRYRSPNSPFPELRQML